MSVQPRALCGRCLRPARACICHWVRPTANPVEVLILQHPMEVHQAKGSARLLHLSLQQCRLEVGETFADADLAAWLGGEAGGAWLLYPETSTAPANSAARTASIAATTAAEPAPIAAAAPPRRLVVLDATWRKSLRMLHLNPRLLALPRLALQAPPPSRYRIRRAHRPDQRSTLEATCQALQQLSPQPCTAFEPLLEAFDGFVAEQAAWADAAGPG